MKFEIGENVFWSWLWLVVGTVLIFAIPAMSGCAIELGKQELQEYKACVESGRSECGSSTHR